MKLSFGMRQYAKVKASVTANEVTKDARLDPHSPREAANAKADRESRLVSGFDVFLFRASQPSSPRVERQLRRRSNKRAHSNAAVFSPRSAHCRLHNHPSATDVVEPRTRSHTNVIIASAQHTCPATIRNSRARLPPPDDGSHETQRWPHVSRAQSFP